MIAVLQETAAPNSDGAIRAGVRLAFVKTADGWVTICDAGKDKNSGCKFDASVPSRWIISDRGKQIGRVTAEGWLDNEYNSETGLMKIVSGAPPWQGARNHNFGGWNDSAVYRPLVATSAEPGSDAHWSEVYPEKMAMSAILPVLRKQVPALPECRSDAKRVAPFGKRRPLGMDDIHVFEAAQSANGGLLAGAAVKSELVRDCDYTADSLADVWLYSDGKSAPRALPALIEQEATHQLIAIGDFAGDGSEEALFWLSGYNEDGFILYYDHFQKAAKYGWSYH
jgi:hypothetical protein